MRGFTLAVGQGRVRQAGHGWADRGAPGRGTRIDGRGVHITISLHGTRGSISSLGDCDFRPEKNLGIAPLTDSVDMVGRDMLWMLVGGLIGAEFGWTGVVFFTCFVAVVILATIILCRRWL